MTKAGTISTFQLFSILLLSRMTALFTFMLPTTGFLMSGDRILTTLPLLMLELIFGFLSVYIINKSEKKSIISAASSFSAVAGKAASIMYIICFIWFAGISVSRFELFISTVMFPNSELYLMTVILLAAAFYAALKGIEALGRASVILSVILTSSIVFIILTVIENFEYTNLTPVLTQGFSPVIRFAFYVSARAVEFITLYTAAPRVRGNIRKMTIIWTLLVSVLTAVILTVLSGVTGKYGDDQIFPLYTLTVIAKFGIFERLDDILTGLWVLSTFIQITFLLVSGVLASEQGFGCNKKITVLLIETTGIFFVYLLTSKTVTSYSEILSSPLQDLFFFTVLIVIPIGITLTGKVKRRKKLCSNH